MKQREDRTAILDFQPLSLDVLREKYAYGDEKLLDGQKMMAAIRKRVAAALACCEAEPQRWERLFLAALENGFIPGGRINNAAGTDLRIATMINCFVQPLADSDSLKQCPVPDIATALQQAGECQRRGGGVGFDFSPIRPKDALHADGDVVGPLTCMQLFDELCAGVETSGARRGAQMAVLRIDHPDILDFVSAKQQPGVFTNFNLSAGVSDAFMQALQRREAIELVHTAEPSPQAKAAGAYRRGDGLWAYRSIDCAALWGAIMHNSYNTAEPGVLFLDCINRENNLHYLEHIEAVNPCGEVPLPAYGCCCLGSLDLTSFVKAPFTEQARFDFAGFEAVIATAVRMLDNVLDVNLWSLPEQRDEAYHKRRIGLGFTGLGDTLIELCLRYDSEAGRQKAAAIAHSLRDTAYRASIALAKEKGPFPLLDADQYLQSGFAERLSESLRVAIRRDGVRNSHLLSIAPAGTISIAFADNCSNGIEPAFAWQYLRKKRDADGGFSEYQVEDHAYRLYRELGGDGDNLPDYFIEAHRIGATEHMLMQAAIQPYIDSAISKTVNIPRDYPFAAYRELFFDAWQAGLKGITTYREGSERGAVLAAVDE